MKKWFLAAVLLPLLGHAQSTVTISGHINTTAPTLVEDFSDYEYFSRHTMERSFIPDSNGNFSITFPLSAPNYFRIHRNVLYLTPGDQVTADLDQVYNTKSKFSGDGAAANNYLDKIAFPKAGSYLNAGQYLYPDPVRTLDTILSFARVRRSELDRLTGVSPEFKRLEKARIQADVLVSIEAAPGYLVFATRAETQDLANAFRLIAEPVVKDYSHGFLDTSFMKLEVYRDVMEDLLKENPENEAARQIKDWKKVRTLISDMSNIGDKPELEAMKTKFAEIRTKGYHDAGLSYLSSLLSFGNGDYAEDITCYSPKGKRIQLSSLK